MEVPETALQIRACVAAVIAFGTALFGWVGWIVIIWITAMILDYLTGTFAAIKNKEWSSSIARQGLWHKAGSIAAVLVAALADIALGVIITGVGGEIILDKLNTDTIIAPAVCVWYIITELGSIIENAGELGAPVPKFLQARLDKLKAEIDKDE